jgi:hypothetical protein
MKKCSTSLAIKDMQIKTITSHTSRPPPTTNVGEDVAKKKPSYTADRNVS